MESKSYRHLKGNVESVNEEGKKYFFCVNFLLIHPLTAAV